MEEPKRVDANVFAVAIAAFAHVPKPGEVVLKKDEEADEAPEKEEE